MATEAVGKILSFDDFISSTEGVEYMHVSVGERQQRIGSLTPTDLDEWNELRATPEGRKVSGAVLIAKSLVDESGARIGTSTPYEKMSDEERGKIAKLLKMNLKVSENLLRAIFALNGIGRTAELAAKNG